MSFSTDHLSSLAVVVVPMPADDDIMHYERVFPRVVDTFDADKMHNDDQGLFCNWSNIATTAVTATPLLWLLMDHKKDTLHDITRRRSGFVVLLFYFTFLLCIRSTHPFHPTEILL
jgi:hypothetical protein